MLSLHSTSFKKISSSSVLLNFGDTDATAAKHSTEYILKYGYLFNVVVCVMGIAMLPYLPSGIQSMMDCHRGHTCSSQTTGPVLGAFKNVPLENSQIWGILNS